MKSSRPRRGYRQSRRAAAQEKTRLSIVEAAVALHSSVGPARTTLSAVAAKAGVSRPTVYRHFPDLASLLSACMGHDMAANPVPDPQAWALIDSGASRLRQGLSDLYGYYRRHRGLSVQRYDMAVADLVSQTDPGYLEGKGPNPEPRVLRLLGAMEPMNRAIEEMIVGTLLGPWEEAGTATASLRAAINVAVDFRTWTILTTTNGLDDDAAAELAARMVLGSHSRS